MQLNETKKTNREKKTWNVLIYIANNNNKNKQCEKTTNSTAIKGRRKKSRTWNDRIYSLIAQWNTQWQTFIYMNGTIIQMADETDQSILRHTLTRAPRGERHRSGRKRAKKNTTKNCLFYLDADGSATVVSIFIKLVLYFLDFAHYKRLLLYLAFRVHRVLSFSPTLALCISKISN